MEDTAKPARRVTGLRAVIALHLTAVVIVGVFCFLDSQGMLVHPVGTWQHAMTQFVGVPVILSIFVFPPAFLIAAVVRGWCMETAFALFAEVLLVIGHLFALPLCQ